jgi:hypothetical protein
MDSWTLNTWVYTSKLSVVCAFRTELYEPLDLIGGHFEIQDGGRLPILVIVRPFPWLRNDISDSCIVGGML